MFVVPVAAPVEPELLTELCVINPAKPPVLFPPETTPDAVDVLTVAQLVICPTNPPVLAAPVTAPVAEAVVIELELFIKPT